MSTRVGGVVLLALTIQLIVVSAHAQSLDEQSLRHDVERILAEDTSRRIFSASEIAKVQSLLKLKRTEEIDRLVASKASIEVVINPEARITASRTEAQLPTFSCGIAEPLLIRIVNVGHVSSVLNARLMEGASTEKISPGEVSPHLSGASVEYRVLMLELNSPQPRDLTIAMDAGPGTDDLNWRSQFSLLLRCSGLKDAADSPGRPRTAEARMR